MSRPSRLVRFFRHAMMIPYGVLALPSAALGWVAGAAWVVAEVATYPVRVGLGAGFAHVLDWRARIASRMAPRTPESPPPDTREPRRRPYLDGQTARRQGKQMADNPHPQLSVAWGEWNEGFHRE